MTKTTKPISQHWLVKSPYVIYQITPWNFRIRMTGMFVAGFWAGYILCNLVNR